MTFGYNPDKPVLHDITWFAKPGQKVALVGATGAGKTTVTNLINRFYDIQEGQILYDGISVAGIKKPDLRRSLGIVLQDVNLFTGTVMDNIRYGRLNATDAEVEAVARAAGCDDFIRQLDQGYDTICGGGGGLLGLLHHGLGGIHNSGGGIADGVGGFLYIFQDLFTGLLGHCYNSPFVWGRANLRWTSPGSAPAGSCPDSSGTGGLPQCRCQ